MLHRRGALALMAGATFVSLRSVPALGQAWSVFRHEALDFTVELPGTPRIEDFTYENSGNPFRSVSAELEFDGIGIGVAQTDAPADGAPPTPEQALDHTRDLLLKALGVPALSERRFVLQGMSAINLSYGIEGFYWLTWVVASPKRYYNVSFTAPARLDEHPVALRVLQSFKLLPNATP